MVAGASAVSQDIPPFCLAEGNRAKLRGLNLVGLRRNFGNEVVDEIKSAFKKLFKTLQPSKYFALAAHFLTQRN